MHRGADSRFIGGYAIWLTVWLCDWVVLAQTFFPWASLTTRLWKGSEHLEVEWTVGPIPFKDGLGREIVVCFIHLPLELQYLDSLT